MARAWPLVPLGTELDDALAGQGPSSGALHEFLPACHGDFSATTGFCFGMLAQLLRIRRGYVLFAAPRFHLFREGGLSSLGVMAFGGDPGRLIEARVPKNENVLWAMEEGLENTAIAAVVGVLPDSARAYGFTASRRIALRASAHGTTAFLLHGRPDSGLASAAQTRWQVAAAPSLVQPWPGRRMPGLGSPEWQVALTKSKKGAPGSWRIRWDDETFSFRLAAPLADRKPVAAHGGEQGSVRVTAR